MTSASVDALPGTACSLISIELLVNDLRLKYPQDIDCHAAPQRLDRYRALSFRAYIPRRHIPRRRQLKLRGQQTRRRRHNQQHVSLHPDERWTIRTSSRAMVSLSSSVRQTIARARFIVFRHIRIRRSLGIVTGPLMLGSIPIPFWGIILNRFYRHGCSD